MADDLAEPAPRRQSRFWLLAPLAVVGLVIVAWCAAWFVIRGRTAQGIDAWIAREAAAGRQWSCPGRSIAGFPFRMEIECPVVTLRRGDLAAEVGRVEAVAQIYRPRHVIVTAQGPLRATEGGRETQARWRRLEASLRTGAGGLQALSAVSEGFDLQLAGAAPEPVTAASERVEFHARPSPGGAAGGSLDIVARAAGAAVPLLDTLLASRDPVQIELQARASGGLGLAGQTLPEELERWRAAGGALDVVLLKVAKGPGRLEARGRLGLDDQRRVAGTLDAAAAGLEGTLRALLGNERAGLAAGLLGAFAGRAGRAPDATPGLQPLPPLRFEGGRAFVGPLPLPGVRLTPLF